MLLQKLFYLYVRGSPVTFMTADFLIQLGRDYFPIVPFPYVLGLENDYTLYVQLTFILSRNGPLFTTCQKMNCTIVVYFYNNNH